VRTTHRVLRVDERIQVQDTASADGQLHSHTSPQHSGKVSNSLDLAQTIEHTLIGAQGEIFETTGKIHRDAERQPFGRLEMDRVKIRERGLEA
jgi:hypothetical protein